MTDVNSSSLMSSILYTVTHLLPCSRAFTGQSDEANIVASCIGAVQSQTRWEMSGARGLIYRAATSGG